jgi:triacylglycerol lipase
MGYRHCGDEIYLDRNGKIRRLTGIWRSRDRWRGLVAGFFNWKLDLLADHSMRLYARHIAAAVEQENRGLAQGREAVDDDELVASKGCEQEVHAGQDSVAT